MVAATYISDLTDITLFEGAGSIGDYGGGGGAASAGIDYAVEGTNAVDKQVNATERGFLFDNGPNFTIGANDHFFTWVVVGTYGLADTRDARGIVVVIGDSTTAFVKFHVAGGDTLPLGGIAPYAVRFNNTTLSNFRTLVGSPGTTPSQIGAGANITGAAKFANLAADACRLGTGYDILNGTGGDPEADFAGIAADDVSTREGIFYEAQGGFLWQGKLRIGSGSTACEFLSKNTNLFLVDTLHALANFTEMLIEHASSIVTLTNVNFVSLVTLAGTANPGRLEVLTSTATLIFNNVGFINFGVTILGSGSTLLGCRWLGCDQVTANSADFGGSTFSGFEAQVIIDSQDETSYDNSPTTEGTFVGGTGHVVSDVLTMSDGSTILVDTVSGGVVTEFTVTSTSARPSTTGVANTQLSSTGPGVSFTLTPEEDNLADTAYLIWDTAVDPNGELDDVSFTKGVNPTHAIEFGTTSPLTMTLTDVAFNDYNASNGFKDSALWFRRTSGTINLTITGGTTPSFKTDGATINLISGSVTVQVTAQEADGSVIENVRVLLKASSGAGPFPFEESVTISNATTLATVTHTGHGMATNDKVEINGASHWQNNGVFTITVNDDNEYEYTLPNDPGSSPTGTIEATFVALEGLTNASGIATASRVYASSQPVTGVARKGSGAPFFKTAELNDTVDNSTGAALTAVMISDE